MRRHRIKSRASLQAIQNNFLAFHNRGRSSANTFETPPTRRNTTDAYMLLLHGTYLTCGYEITSPMSYRNVGFFLSPLPRTASEFATKQTDLASSVTTNFIPYYLDKKYRREDTHVWCNLTWTQLYHPHHPPLPHLSIIMHDMLLYSFMRLFHYNNNVESY